MNQLYDVMQKVSFGAKLLVGGTSGVLATSIVYPMDFVKTTMQVRMETIRVIYQRQVAGKNMLYKNPIEAFKGIIKADGVQGLYWYEF